jgi:hypothetical protein
MLDMVSAGGSGMFAAPPAEAEVIASMIENAAAFLRDLKYFIGIFGPFDFLYGFLTTLPL